MNPDMIVDSSDPVKGPETVTLLETIATLPSGKPGAPLTQDELGKYIAQNYGTADEKDRNARHALRDELYRDGGVAHMTAFIDDVFTDPLIKKLRQKWVKYARFDNVTKRLVNELSTVYSEPARRVVSDPQPLSEVVVAEDPANPLPPPDPNQIAYDRLLEVVRMDERMVEVNSLLNLHRALLVGFRVRQRPNGDREPVIDIATPANVRAIMHPNDNTEVIAWMIKTDYRSAKQSLDQPAWTVWTDHESFQLRADLSVIGDSWVEHGLGVCPWVPVTLGAGQPGFWPGNDGEDIPAAHVATWFINILLLKETKSATKQTLVTGDGTNTGRGQAADTEVPGELADGQTATTVDMSMDLTKFTGTSDHVIQSTAQNYGISPALITHQGVQSAQARELMRLPLRELRRKQQVPLRRFERQFAIVMSMVVKVDAPEYNFDPSSWRIEFAESETPLDPLAQLMLFERMRAAGITDTVEFLRKMYPGISDEGAFDRMRRHVSIELTRNIIMRPLQAIQGTLDAAIEGAAAGAKVDATTPIEDGMGSPAGPPVSMSAAVKQGSAPMPSSAAHASTPAKS